MPTWFHRFTPWLFLCFWSAGYSVAKLGLQFTSPLNLLAFRFLGAFIALAPFLLIFRIPLPEKSAWKALAGLGLVLQVGHFGGVYVGLKLGASANVMALFAASQPVLVVLATALFTRALPRPQVWLGLTLGLTGAAWVIFVDAGSDAGYVLGAILGFVAVVALCLGQVIEKRRKLGVHPLMATWVQYLFAGVVSAPLAFWLEGLNWSSDPTFLKALGYLVFGNSLIGIMLMFSMVRRGSLAQVSAIMFLVPAMAALIAWPVVGEILSLYAIPGMLLAMAGAVWTRRFA